MQNIALDQTNTITFEVFRNHFYHIYSNFVYFYNEEEMESD